MSYYHVYKKLFRHIDRKEFSNIVNKTEITMDDRLSIYFSFLKNVYDLSEKIIKKCGTIWNSAFELDDLVCKGEEILYGMTQQELDSDQNYFKFYTRFKHRLVTASFNFTNLCCSDKLFDKYWRLLNAEMKLGEDASSLELAEYMDTDENEIMELSQISDIGVVSYETLNSSIITIDLEDEIISKLSDEYFIKIIKNSNLTNNERLVLSALYGVNLMNNDDERIEIGRVYTQYEVAQIMNRSNKLVSKIKVDAFSKIRNIFAVNLVKRINVNDLRRIIDNLIDDDMQKAFLFSYFGIKDLGVLQKYKLYCDGIPKSVMEIYLISGVSLYLVKDCLQKGINKLAGFVLRDTDKEISHSYLR